MSNNTISMIGLDPLFQSYRKILIRHIHDDIKVNTHDNLLEFKIYNRSISKVEIVGIIIKRDIKRTNKIMLVIDDGTGIITCNKMVNENNINSNNTNNHHTYDYRIGDLVTIKGKITMSTYITNDNNNSNNDSNSSSNNNNYYNANQYNLHIHECYPCCDSLEVLHWLTAIDLMNKTYKNKITLS